MIWICIYSCRKKKVRKILAIGLNRIVIRWLEPGEYVLTVLGICYFQKFYLTFTPESFIELVLV